MASRKSIIARPLGRDEEKNDDQFFSHFFLLIVFAVFEYFYIIVVIYLCFGAFSDLLKVVK